MVVNDVQRLWLLLRPDSDELEVLSFSLGLLGNSTTDHFVVEACQSTCVPNKDVVDISFAGPAGRWKTSIKRIHDDCHNLLSSRLFVIVGDVENLANAEGIHGLLLADGLQELG